MYQRIVRRSVLKSSVLKISVLKSSITITALFSIFVFLGIREADAISTGDTKSMTAQNESIVLGGGCFWCMEAIFQQFKGILHVESGYAGGEKESPTYHEVGDGDTGHAEVVRVEFDPKVISLSQVLTIFFHAHDPTTKNQQGADVGSQYRSAILYSSEAQHQTVTKVQDQIILSHLWGEKPIVTEIAPLKKFYRAEDYHQNYYRSNPSQPYCSYVIGPKVQKIRKEFAALLKEP